MNIQMRQNSLWRVGNISAASIGQDRICLSVGKNYFALLSFIHNLKNYKIALIKSESGNYQKGTL